MFSFFHQWCFGGSLLQFNKMAQTKTVSHKRLTQQVFKAAQLQGSSLFVSCLMFVLVCILDRIILLLSFSSLEPVEEKSKKNFKGTVSGGAFY